MAVLRDRIDDNPQSVEGDFSRKHGRLHICGEKQHFWSPCLELTVAEDDESEEGVVATRVWGTFSPRPEIWLGFVFAIGVCLVVALLAMTFAVAQIMLGHRPWALMVPVVSLLIAVGIYVSAIVGQGLSGDEMYRIRSYVDECLREAEEHARFDPPTRPDSSSQL